MHDLLRIILRQSLVLTKANMKSRFRGTTAGFLWVMMLPILTYAAQGYAFYFILKLHYQNYPLFLLTGLIPWILISSSLEMSASSIINQGLLLKSLPIQPMALILSQLIDNFFNYSLAFLLLLIPVGVWVDMNLFYFFFLILPLVSSLIFIVALSQLINTVNVFFRDTKFVLSFVLQISYFLTPIFYPKELIPQSLQWYIKINPFHILLAPFQSIVSEESFLHYWELTGKSFVLSVSLLAVSLVVWRKKRNVVYLSI